MAGYRLSVEALKDLENIWFYGAEQWGMNRADEYSVKLDKMCEFLAENPGIGTSKEELYAGLVGHPLGSHTIYYLKLEKTILVVRILHQSMDAETQLLN